MGMSPILIASAIVVFLLLIIMMMRSRRRRLLLISACAEELLPWKEVDMIEEGKIVRIRIGARKYDYMASGVGKVAAALAVARAHALGYRRILWFGTAGSRSLPLGQIVVVRKSFYLDVDFTALGMHPYQLYSEPILQTASPGFSEQLAREFQIQEAISGTRDSFLQSNKDGADLVDCEDAAAMQAARHLPGMEIGIVRYISDHFDPDSYKKSVATASARLRCLLLSL